MKLRSLLATGLVLAVTSMVIAQDVTTAEDLKAKMDALRAEWEVKVQDELSQLPQDVQASIEAARAAAESYRNQIQTRIASAGENIDIEQFKAMMESTLADAKTAAVSKIQLALEEIEAYKVENQEQLTRVQAEVQARIEAKKAELEAKRAEIEALIQKLQ